MEKTLPNTRRLTDAEKQELEQVRDACREALEMVTEFIAKLEARPEPNAGQAAS